MKTFAKVALAGLAAVTLGAVFSTSPALASFHLWKVQEVFTNFDGSVQFVELFTNFGGQTFVAGQTLTAISDGLPVPYTMPANISNGNAANTLLLATAGFSALTGGIAVTPDFPTVPLPNNFFKPNAVSITLNFAGFDSITFAGSAIPKDGVHSLTDINLGPGQTLTITNNSPRNSAGQSGVVVVPTGGDFDENNSVNGADLAAWRTGFGLSGAATHMQGDADADLDVDGADLLVWQREVGTFHVVVAGTAVPEPASISLLLTAAAIAAARRRK